jgi:hypothetical protein
MFIQLTSAAVETYRKPLAINTEHIVAFGPLFESDEVGGEHCRLNMLGAEIAIVAESFAEVWNMIHGTPAKRQTRKRTPA